MINYTDTLKEIVETRRSRRKFLTQAGLTALGAVALNQTPAFGKEAKEAQVVNPFITDVSILNFALNLEYLEAEFYLRAAFGRGLSASDITGLGTQGGVIGGRKVDFENNLIRQYALEIAEDEEAHVKFIRSALGSNAVARPAIDIGPAFTAAAVAAGIIPAGQTFDAYGSDVNFLLAAFIFEDVGVTAYKGAARFIENKDTLEAAAGILAVEAYHAAEIRTVLAGMNAMNPTAMIATIAQRISDLRDSVDGPTDLDQGIIVNGRTNIVPADANGLAFSRTMMQVLSIVYLGGTTSGGFFPNGVNPGPQ